MTRPRPASWSEAPRNSAPILPWRRGACDRGRSGERPRRRYRRTSCAVDDVVYVPRLIVDIAHALVQRIDCPLAPEPFPHVAPNQGGLGDPAPCRLHGQGLVQLLLDADLKSLHFMRLHHSSDIYITQFLRGVRMQNSLPSGSASTFQVTSGSRLCPMSTWVAPSE